MKKSKLKSKIIELQRKVIDLQAENYQLECNLDECKLPTQSQDYQDLCGKNEELEIQYLDLIEKIENQLGIGYHDFPYNNIPNSDERIQDIINKLVCNSDELKRLANEINDSKNNQCIYIIQKCCAEDLNKQRENICYFDNFEDAQKKKEQLKEQTTIHDWIFNIQSIWKGQLG